MTNNVNPLLQMQNIKKDFFGNQVLTDINFTLGEGKSWACAARTARARAP